MTATSDTIDTSLNEFGHPMVVGCGYYENGHLIKTLNVSDVRKADIKNSGFFWIGAVNGN